MSATPPLSPLPTSPSPGFYNVHGTSGPHYAGCWCTNMDCPKCKGRRPGMYVPPPTLDPNRFLLNLPDWYKANKVEMIPEPMTPINPVPVPPYRRRPPSLGVYAKVDRAPNVAAKMMSMEMRFINEIRTLEQRVDSLNPLPPKGLNSPYELLQVRIDNIQSKIGYLLEGKEDYKDVLDRLEELAQAIEVLEAEQ